MFATTVWRFGLLIAMFANFFYDWGLFKDILLVQLGYWFFLLFAILYCTSAGTTSCPTTRF